MMDVMQQSMTLRLDKVENIVVTGDTATADVTITAIIGGQQEQTQTRQGRAGQGGRRVEGLHPGPTDSAPT